MANLLTEAQRAEALIEDCTYCEATAGQRCVNPKTGEPLVHQVAHQVRIKKAGVTQNA